MRYAAILVLLVCSLPVLALNQVVNGSFEEGVVGFWQAPADQLLPPPWSKWDAHYAGHPGGNWNINVDGHDNVPSGSPPDGEHVASVCAGMNWNSGGIWQEIDVTPGLTFYLSGSYYAGSGWSSSAQVTAQVWLFNGPPVFDASGDLVTSGGAAALNYTGPRTSGWQTFYGGGMTATGGKLYVVSRFRVTDPWSAYGMHMDNLVLHASPVGSPSEPASLLRNGSFRSGLSDWVVCEPNGAWDALAADLSAHLSPPVDGYEGASLHQNLNYTGVGGVSFRFSTWLRKVNGWTGENLAVYAHYVDSQGAVQRVRVLCPESDDVAYNDWTLFSGAFALPADAQRLVKLSFDKEGYGEFDADGVMLLADAVVNSAPLPRIDSWRKTEIADGSEITIAGADFGALTAASRVTIGAAVADVVSWSPAMIKVRLTDPEPAGPLTVVADGVESNSVVYTSQEPRYGIQVINPRVRVVRGENAEFVIRVDLLDGFPPGSAINFALDGAPAGAAVFSPVPVRNQGGVRLVVDTTGVPAGSYRWQVHSFIGGPESYSARREIRLDVVNTTGGEFYTLGPDGRRTVVSSLNLSGQRRVYLHVAGAASDGQPLPDDTPVALTSTCNGLHIYRTPWGDSEIYADANGSGAIRAEWSDGYSVSIPVTVSVPPSPSITGITCVPQTADNSGTHSVTFYVSATDALGAACDYGMGQLLGYTPVWSNGGRNLTASGRVPEGVEPGTYLLHAWLNSSPQAERAQPLAVVNDSARGMLEGGVYSTSETWAPDIIGTLEFYSQSGVLAGSRRIAGWGGFALPCIMPGSYRLRFVPDTAGLAPQWYPNAYSYTEASPVTVAAGATAAGVFFFPGDAGGTANRIGAIRDLPDGVRVTLGAKSLYFLAARFGYVEEPDRSAGIRIEGELVGTAGSAVSLTGTMRTSLGGERYVQVDDMSAGADLPVAPVGMCNRWLAEARSDGLYVAAWGRVIAGSVTSNSYRVTDGSDEQGVLVVTQDSPSVGEGEFVIVRGAAGFDSGRVVYAE